MPNRKKFDKKSAKTFSLVHRAHDDALFIDNESSKHVLVPAPSKHLKHDTNTMPGAKKKIYSASELENQLSKSDKHGIGHMRENEGLAAQYNIFYDDTKYDYMQHLKPIGTSLDSVFIERKGLESGKKTKDISELFEDQLPSKEKVPFTYDTFQNIPQELRGFQPDMDPRLREVLEALDDEAYIEEENVETGNQEKDGADIFASLLESGQVDENEFYYHEDLGSFDDDEEWDLDNYQEEYDRKYDSDRYEEQDLPYNEGEAPEELMANGDSTAMQTNWESDFMRFKNTQNKTQNTWDSDDEFGVDDELPDLPNIKNTNLSKKTSNSKMRKKKGAMTDTSSFSMSSSALFRTEGLTLLDDRYEQLAKKFEHDDDVSSENLENFDMEKERFDLENMLDEFLDNYELESGGRKLVKKSLEKKKLQDAADSVSKGKVALKRKKAKDISKDPVQGLGGSLGHLQI